MSIFHKLNIFNTLFHNKNIVEMDIADLKKRLTTCKETHNRMENELNEDIDILRHGIKQLSSDLHALTSDLPDWEDKNVEHEKFNRQLAEIINKHI